VVAAFLQDPRKEVPPIRGLFTQTIALRLRSRGEVATVRGEGLTDAAPAHRTSPETPGTGYVVAEDGSAMWGRADYWTDTQPTPQQADTATGYKQKAVSSMAVHSVRETLVASAQFPELLTAEQVSALLGVSAATLNRWAAIREQTGQQIGPPCYSLSERVRRWDTAEVRKWLKQVRR